MPPQETSRGLEYFKNIVESGRTLKLGWKAVNQGWSYLLHLSGFGKEFSLSRGQIDDLPGTVGYHEPANALARSLESRFKNVDPNYFVTVSGRLLNIDVEWPPLPWMTPQGLTAATGQWVQVTDIVSGQVARCIVQTTHQQSMFDSSPYRLPSQIINTVRHEIDSGSLAFYSQANLPAEFTATRLRVGEFSDTSFSTQDYLVNKVWFLAFVAGSGARQTRVWIADPWDAEYLGCTVAELRRNAAVLDAQGLIILSEDEDFASVGKALLATNGPIMARKKAAKATFRTALSTYTPIEKPLGEGGSGKVLLVSDHDGDRFALNT